MTSPSLQFIVITGRLNLISIFVVYTFRFIFYTLFVSRKITFYLFF